MGLIFLGSVDAASDATMTTVTNQVNSLFRGALTDLIEVVLADNPTVEAAAAAAATVAAEDAVADQIANGDLVAAVPETELTRSTRTVVPMTFRDKTRATLYPAIYPAIYPAVTWINEVRRRADIPVLDAAGKISADVLPDTSGGILNGLQVQAVPGGPLVLEVREDGKTYIQDAVIVNGAGGGTSVRRVVIVAALGQSNAVAHGQPIVDLFDGVSSRIWQLPDGGTQLIPAAVPLTMPGGTATGLAPAHVLARKIALNDPECVVVIVPAAKGGSGLVTDPALGYGKWAIDYAGANPHLYQNAVDMMTLALAEITTRWGGGIVPSVVTTWLQGEADGADNVLRATYQAALDALIADWLTRYGGIFLIAGIVPQAATSGTRPEIVLALQDTPRRVQRTAHVPGVDNGGGARGPSDGIHYGREAIEQIGDDWFEAIPVASNNVTGSYTVSPLKVKASKWGSEVSAEWSAPYCRVTAYEVQSSPDGATWSSVTVAEPVARRVTFTSASPVKVRVRAIGTETSSWTAPVNAIGS